MEIPASVRCIDARAFYECESLTRVVLTEGSRLERIGNECFRGSGIEEMTLPGTLREIGTGVFYECDNLKTIYVEDGCEADFLYTGIPDSKQVCPLPETMVGGVRVWDLR